MWDLNRTGIRPPASRSGFTLIELVLTVVLLLLLIGAVVFNFGSLQSKSDLEEGARQVEALIHFARAQSLALGKKVEVRLQLASDSPSTSPSPGTSPPPSLTTHSDSSPFTVGIEEDPIRTPGTFTPLPGAQSFIEGIQDRVHIRELSRLHQDLYPPDLNTPTPLPQTSSDESGTFDARILPGAKVTLPQDKYRTTLTQAQDSPQETQHFIHFYPDGSSDDAELVLKSTSSTDHRKIRIRLRGISGTLSREWQNPSESELLSEELSNEAQSDLPDSRRGGTP